MPRSMQTDGRLCCAGSSDGLREEVMRSAWYEAFRADMRSSVLVRAVEVGLGQVGYATSWTSNKLAAASQGFRYASVAMRSCSTLECASIANPRTVLNGWQTITAWNRKSCNG